MKNLTVLVVVLAAACGKDKSAAPPPAAPIDVAGVNALVPADLKDKLVFEKRELTEERGKKSKRVYTVAAPKDWEQDMKMFASVKPKSESNLGFMTSFAVGSNCNGTCEPKDWAKESEKVNFAQLRDGKILKDDQQKTSHLMIAEKGDSTYVAYAWWKDGGRMYYTCTASLEEPVKGAADAFAKACQAVGLSGDLD
jgi:hypothetical protein